MKKIYILTILMFIISAGFAATRYWVGGAAGNWNTTASWSASSGGAGGASVPVAGDAVFFDNGLTVAVVYDAAVNDLGLSNFSVTNNTLLTLTNTVNATRSLSINGTATTYYEVVAAGSSLTLRNNLNTVFNLGSTALSSGRMVFNGNISCVNQAANTSNGPRLNAQDSIILNALYYIGPAITQTGSNPTGTKFRFGATAVYQLDKNGGVILSAKYAPASLIKITGTSTAFPSTWNAPNTYGSVEFNAPAASSPSVGNLAIPSNTIFQGDFTVTNLGTSAGIRLASTPTNILIQGNLNLNNGILSLANSVTAGSLTVAGNFVQSAGTTLDLQNSSASTIFNLKGTLNSLGTITENGSSTASSIVFNGTSVQNLSFVTITNDVRFQVNNPAGTLVSNDWNMPNSANSRITLTSGNINLNGNTLNLANPSVNALSGGSSTSHIIGELNRVTGTAGVAYAYPVSDNAVDIATISITPAAAGEYTVSFSRPNPFDRNAVPAPIINAGDYIWNITQVSGTTANVNFTYGGFDNGGITDPSTVRGLHWNGSSWDNLGGTDGGGSSVNVAGIADFSPIVFTLGTEVTILPVTIEYFSGIKTGNTNQLDWKVSCTNTPEVTLTLERSSDGRNFRSIYSIYTNAVRCQQPFANTDLSPAAGTNYYRLKVTDADGKTTYSTVVALLNRSTGFEIVSLMPNPVHKDGALTVNLSSAKAAKLQILITDVNGKRVQTNVLAAIAGSNRLLLSLPGLAAGSYQLTAINDDGVKITARFIKE